MDISEFALRLMLLFLPGIICLYIVDALTVHRERQSHDSLIRAFVYGIVAYTCYAVALIALNKLETTLGVEFRDNVTITRSLVDSKFKLDVEEIAWVTVVAVLLGFLISCGISHEWLHGCATKFGVSRKFGQLNVWQRTFSAKDTKWATLRDLDRNLMFAGRVRAFSDVEDIAELFLSEVIVYNESTGAELYRADHMYLARQRCDITVEIPNPAPAVGKGKDAEIKPNDPPEGPAAEKAKPPRKVFSYKRKKNGK